MGAATEDRLSRFSTCLRGRVLPRHRSWSMTLKPIAGRPTCPSAAVARNDEGQVHLSHLLALVHVPVLLRISQMVFTTSKLCAGVFSKIFHRTVPMRVIVESNWIAA